MGIRGLTTFINNRSHLYLKDCELHDCNVVLDGNSIASNLYKWHCKSNDCFGGDYDKFAHIIQNFFSLLSQCNIIPYVILDGGYEKRKLATVISRMKNKIRAAESLNSVTEGSESVFPLFLREVFVDVVLSLNIKVARCEFEGDMEIAGIAQTLKCPVVSYDSDFYIFGCIYIPFNSVDLTARKGKDKSIKTPYTYLSCKIYHIQNFLKAFGGLDQKNLPLLAVLLGNDYIKGSLFKPFFRNLKIQKCNGNQSDQQKRIKSVIIWLQNENVESAIRTILGRFKEARRQLVLKKIREAMKGYFDVNSEMLKFLGIEPTNEHNTILPDFDRLSIEVPEYEENKKKDTSSSDTENCSSISENDDLSEHSEYEVKEQDSNTNDNKDVNIISDIFYKKYRKCQYPACFMDVMTLNRYYCIPQVEDGASTHSHTISLDILTAIHQILTNNNKGLITVARTGKGRIQYSTLPVVDKIYPTIEEIEKLSLKEKRQLLANILQIDNKFLELLKLLPIEWHLFLLSLKYCITKGTFDIALVYSCLICFLILNYVDSQVGFYRGSKTFDKKFASFLLENKNKSSESKFETFESLPYKDCVVFMDILISYFQMDMKLKSNHRLYDKVLVHSMSQIQSVLLHMKYLNSLLNNCYPSLEIHKLFNGTFIYNMTNNLRKRTNIKEYLEVYFKDCQSVLAGISYVFSLVGSNFDCFITPVTPLVKRHRKKNRKKPENIEEIIKVSEDEKETILDPNNPYSLLAVL